MNERTTLLKENMRLHKALAVRDTENTKLEAKTVLRAISKRAARVKAL